MRATAELPVSLPEIPRKRYFAIGEVAELCAVKPHVLRYWEQEFPQLKPSKRRGNRRYYQHDDVQMVRRIRSLLYEQGFTIGGARQQLKDHTRAEPEPILSNAAKPQTAESAVARKQRELGQIRDELESLLKRWPF
ncbi:MAG: MerR family transcriptional regulator [Nevskia sp.]|nr:MerR family transcriptional regulator [Nevskia sp.]